MVLESEEEIPITCEAINYHITYTPLVYDEKVTHQFQLYFHNDWNI